MRSNAIKFGLTLFGLGSTMGAAVGVLRIPGAANACKPPTTHYNQVRQISSHNSYDRCGMNPAQCTPKGTIEQQADTGVRSFEFDIHSKGKGIGGSDPSHSDWAVFHTTNSWHGGDHCQWLSECLGKLRKWHDNHPNHEVMTIWLELKDDWSTGGHMPIDLDNNRLARELGGVVIRPADLLDACPGARTLQDAVRSCGWPSLESIRGKFFVVLMGNDPAEAAYLDDVNQYRAGSNNGYAGPKTCFVGPDLSGDCSTQLARTLPVPSGRSVTWENAVFFNVHNSDGLGVASCAYDRGVVSRVWRVDGNEEWRSARQSRAHHLATDQVMTAIQYPRAVDSCGMPFEIIGPGGGH